MSQAYRHALCRSVDRGLGVVSEGRTPSNPVQSPKQSTHNTTYALMTEHNTQLPERRASLSRVRRSDNHHAAHFAHTRKAGRDVDPIGAAGEDRYIEGLLIVGHGDLTTACSGHVER
jgi:hypothetical protein